jgi:hypothetical protein
MASVLASSTVDCMFEPQFGQTGRQQLQKPKSIDGCSEKTFMSRNNTRIFMFYGPWIHLGMMYMIYSSIRMCELKYIGSFITVLFISNEWRHVRILNKISFKIEFYILCSWKWVSDWCLTSDEQFFRSWMQYLFFH